MKPKPETWTVVVAGAWNTRLFSPEWVGKHLLADQPMSIEVPFAGPVSHLKLTAGGVVLIPTEDRLVVGVQEATLAAMQKAEDVARKAVVLLAHTPTAAVGINFGFEDQSPSAGLTEIFRMSDAKRLSGFGCAVKQTSISRRIEIDGRALNITHALVDTGVQIHVNFHFDAATADVAVNVLQGQAESCLLLARKFLSSVYDVKIKERDDEQPI
jgi:hypothetical protein